VGGVIAFGGLKETSGDESSPLKEELNRSIEIGDLRTAFELARLGVDKHPADIYYPSMLFMVSRELDNIYVMEEMLEKLESSGQKDTGLLKRRGIYQAEVEKNLEAAAGTFERAVEAIERVSGDSLYFRIYAGRCYIGLENYEKALEKLKGEVKPTNSLFCNLYFYRSLAYLFREGEGDRRMAADGLKSLFGKAKEKMLPTLARLYADVINDEYINEEKLRNILIELAKDENTDKKTALNIIWVAGEVGDIKLLNELKGEIKDKNASDALDRAFFKDEILQEDSKMGEMGKWLKRKPDLLFFKLELAEAYRENRRNEEARVFYEEILDSEPKNAAALFGLGVVLKEEKRYEDSLKKLKRASELVNKESPDMLNIHFISGLVYLDMNRYKEADDQFSKAVKMGEKLKIDDEFNIMESQVNRAFAKIELYEYEEAKTILEEFINKIKKKESVDPRIASSAYIALSKCYLGLSYEEGSSMYEKAYEAAERAYELSADDTSGEESKRVDACLQKGILLVQDEEYDRALEYYLEAKEMAPSEPEIYNQISIALRGKGDYDGAEELLHKLPILNPETEDFFQFSLGLINMERGALKEAENNFDRAKELGYEINRVDYFKMALSLMQEGRKEDAAGYAGNIFASSELPEKRDNIYVHSGNNVNPGVITDYLIELLSENRIKKDRTRKNILWFLQKVSPQDLNEWIGIFKAEAEEKYHGEDFDEALRLAEKTLRLSPGDKNALGLKKRAGKMPSIVSEARKHLKKGDLEKAEKKCNEGLTLDPEYLPLKNLKNDIEKAKDPSGYVNKIEALIEEGDAFYNEGNLKEAKGKYEEAVITWNEIGWAVTGQEKERIAKKIEEISGVLSVIETEEKNKELEGEYNTAIDNLKLGNFIDAAKGFQNIVNKNPQHEAAVFLELLENLDSPNRKEYVSRLPHLGAADKRRLMGMIQRLETGAAEEIRKEAWGEGEDKGEHNYMASNFLLPSRWLHPDGSSDYLKLLRDVKDALRYAGRILMGDAGDYRGDKEADAPERNRETYPSERLQRYYDALIMANPELSDEEIDWESVAGGISMNLMPEMPDTGYDDFRETLMMGGELTAAVELMCLSMEKRDFLYKLLEMVRIYKSYVDSEGRIQSMPDFEMKLGEKGWDVKDFEAVNIFLNNILFTELMAAEEEELKFYLDIYMKLEGYDSESSDEIIYRVIQLNERYFKGEKKVIDAVRSLAVSEAEKAGGDKDGNEGLTELIRVVGSLAELTQAPAAIPVNLFKSGGDVSAALSTDFMKTGGNSYFYIWHNLLNMLSAQEDILRMDIHKQNFIRQAL